MHSISFIPPFILKKEKKKKKKKGLRLRVSFLDIGIKDKWKIEDDVKGLNYTQGSHLRSLEI